ncbi:1,2-phenylacetyl-CoA epoxidase subunit PaaC [Taibaiella koreensis]|uniref:1,2-phenylacetyl-CoA epoxidase subunit PaaC n=1 Tax=Taibaiella koreensis TaxID=1268548 RepID=UPI000E59EF45|nr:1,2-phenylacetyl-CoA epoxidase subunit PaaC [Taibaiella koreensis]
MTSIHQLNYVLQLADNALILGHRISEWTGHGPILEQDIAITNTALDHLGQARSLYQYAAELYNQLPAEIQEEVFSSPAFLNHKQPVTEDTLAYLRDAWDFRNVLLVEQDNGDWAYTIARSFFYDNYSVLLYTALRDSKDATIAAVAEKSLKEALYHRRWSSEWVIRLGDGTGESKDRMQEAIQARWEYTGELFEISDADKVMLEAGTGADLAGIRSQWLTQVAEVLGEATLEMPSADAWMQTGGKAGKHSEHLGYILAEMQYMQRAYPGMEW